MEFSVDGNTLMGLATFIGSVYSLYINMGVKKEVSKLKAELLIYMHDTFVTKE
jgi:hypothetical protein